MIGKEEEQEVSFKVADRRKFNPDGSVKEGVTLDAEPVREVKPAESEKVTAETPALSEPEIPEGITLDPEEGDEDAADSVDDIPGADDPASFVNFLSMLATNAATALGAVPHPSTGQRMLDLDTGKYWLDVIGMVKEKTKGNLHEKESRLLDSLLGDLRMQYVHLVKATEEKLKAQAAKKFSGGDILGKK
ncbi:MAG: DUF1844 domain-containing protein [Acidobacteria bacterium]|nr:DUF1844 domain-containing protein [Acidobacteriota bacterium]